MKIKISLLLLAISCSSVFGQNQMSDSQKEILQVVLSTNRVITKELHDDFWRDVPAQFRTETSEFLIRFTQMNVLNLNDFETEGWKSLRLSIINKTPCLTLRYIKLKETILKESENSSGFAAGSAESFIYKERIKKRLDDSYERTLSWIEAAAAGRPVQMESGNKISFTTQMIDEAISSSLDVKTIQSRLEKLLNPTWK